MLSSVAPTQPTSCTPMTPSRPIQFIRTLPGLLLIAAALTVSSVIHAAVVERVIAVVGERVILLSDLQVQARPHLQRLYREVPAGSQRTAAISQLYKALVQRVVDEELQQHAAQRSRLTVTTDEIDNAIGRVAIENNLEVTQVMAEARANGFTDHLYRQEIRRQLLEAKLLNLRVQGRLQVTDEDLRSAYRKLILEERTKLHVDLAWIRLDAPRGGASTKSSATTQRTLAEELSHRARAHQPFAALAQAYSHDTSTRDAGGSLGRHVLATLPRALAQTVLTLEEDEVSSPIQVGRSWVILKLVARQPSTLPAFETVQEQLHQRVYMNKMSRARRQWLDHLRKRTHVEIRL